MGKRSRIRWRFRLSTLLILVAIAGVWMAVKFNRQPLSFDNLSDLRLRERIDIDAWKVVWNTDGRRVAIVGWEKPVQIFDAATLWKIRTIGEGKKIIHFAFSADENIVAYCENGKKPCIFDLRSNQTIVLDTENGQSKPVFSPDGKILATGKYGTAAWLWDVRSGKLLKELDVGATAGGLRPVFSPDGKSIAIGHRNSTTRLFDVESGELLHEFPKRSSQELQFHPTLPILAIAYVDANIGLWNVNNGELVHQVKTTAQEIYTLDWSPDGRILASAGLHGDINLWKGDDLSLMHTIAAPEWVISVRFRPDMRGLFVAGGERQSGGRRYVEEMVVPSLAQKLFW